MLQIEPPVEIHKDMSTAPRSPDSPSAASTPPAKENQTPKTAERKSSRPGGANPCAHPRVQIVAREEDAEFVECLECREVFESSEFRDMAIEEKIEGSSAE